MLFLRDALGAFIICAGLVHQGAVFTGCQVFFPQQHRHIDRRARQTKRHGDSGISLGHQSLQLPILIIEAQAVLATLGTSPF
jgi:hypothetical protein